MSINGRLGVDFLSDSKAKQARAKVACLPRGEPSCGENGDGITISSDTVTFMQILIHG